jgi:hypothetical protein
VKIGKLLNFKMDRLPMKTDQFQGSMNACWSSVLNLKRIGLP